MRTSYLSVLSLLGLGLLLILGGCNRTPLGPVPDDDDSAAGDDDDTTGSDDDDTTGSDDDDTTGSDDDDTTSDDDDTTGSDDDDTTGDTCADDIYEENDVPEQASPLTAGTHSDLRMCPSEKDYYSITLSAGDDISVEIAFSNDGGDIDARLFGPTGTQLDSGASTDDNEQLATTADTTGTYAIEIELYSETDDILGNDYTLDIVVTNGAGDDDDSTTGDDDDSVPGDDDDSSPSGSDADGDGVLDSSDNCPNDANTNQENADGDAQGDACDACPNSATGDTDGDGVCDNLDLCTGVDSTGDSDSDGICDDSDVCTGADSSGDSDSDGVCDDSDACPNSATGDTDGDGVCDNLDLCTGNDTSGDSDSDGVCTDIDNCPNDANTNQLDSDSNGIGDVCEPVAPPSTCTAGATLSCANNTDSHSNGGAGSTDYFGEGAYQWGCFVGLWEQTGPEFIYEFTAEDSGTHTVSLSSNSGNLDLAILEGGSGGTCAPSSCITSAIGQSPQATFNATLGMTYFIVVDGYLNTTANYDITITPPDADGDGIGDSCDPQTQGPCIADSYEDNDTSSAASALTDGSYSGLTTCPSDSDWYSVALVSGDILQVDATFVDADGDLDLFLYDTAGNLVDSSESGTNNETLGPYTAPTAGNYLIEAILFASGDGGSTLGNSYDLDIDVTLAPCVSDSYEANNSLSAAAPISTGFTSNLTACSGDDDWYSIELWVGDTLELDANFVHSEGDIDIYLFDPSESQVAQSAGVSNLETVTHTAPETGTYFLRARLFSDGGALLGNPYSLGATVTAGDDGLEDNDSSFDALEIPGYRVDDLRVLSGDDDWYAVDLGVGDTLAVNVNFTDSEGDIDLYVYAPGSGGAGSTVRSSTSVTNNESTSSYTATSAGLHYIKVTLYLDDTGGTPGNLYEMETIVARHSSNWNDNDFFEYNDTQSSAAAVEDTYYWGLTANGATDEDDWYSIYLESGQTIDVDLRFVDSNADLDLEFRSSTSGLDYSLSASNNEDVSYTVSSSGTYYVRVTVFGSGSTDYEMGITIN
jgi:hypothetical protein